MRKVANRDPAKVQGLSCGLVLALLSSQPVSCNEYLSQLYGHSCPAKYVVFLNYSTRTGTVHTGVWYRYLYLLQYILHIFNNF
jgi:hypothetical protein